jgi:vitamin K-dependent gamma-carboxylase
VAVFRIVLGAMVAWDALRYLHYGWIDEYYVRPAVHFTYPLFSFVKPWPGAWMYVHFWGLALLALLVSVGLFYRVAIGLLFLGYAYVFLLEQSVYMNHYYLILLLLLLFVWIPAHRLLSLDRYRHPESSDTVPRWAVLILRFQLALVYVYGGIAKLNQDWLRGEPMYSALVKGAPELPEFASHLPPALIAYAIAYGGVAVDFAIPALLAARRTFLAGFALAVGFHVLNDLFLRIGVFSYLMIGAITIFLPPDWPRRLLPAGWFASRSLQGSVTAPARSRAPVLLFLHLYAIVQLLVPLRHLLYPGPVSWTEEGHRFAWHMKLRKKESLLTITATDFAGGRTWTIDPSRDLVPRQQRKLETFPDILLQYVHHHRDRLRAEGISDPVITVDWLCSLNGRPHQRLVDPTVNLAEVKRSWRPATWILPLDEAAR